MLDSAKESLNRVSFSFWRNAGSDWISLTDAGREFHAWDAATGNARSPRVDRRVSSKTSVDVAADRRRRREVTSAVRGDEASQQGTEAQCHVGNDASEHTAETGFSPVLLASVVHGEVELWYPSSVFLAADRSFGSMFPGLAEPSSQLARVSAGQCLKLCDDTPSVATPPKQNNPQDLDPECLAASFLVQWTLAHGSADKRQCGMNGVPDSVLLKQEVVIR